MLLQSQPQKEIDLTIKSTGFKILKSRFNQKEIQISASSLNKKTESNYFILTRNQIGNLKKQLPSGVELQEILQDTIFLNLGTLVSKKLPVKANLNLKFHIGYDLSEKVLVKPDSILVSGPKLHINKLKVIELEPISIDDVKSDFSKKVSIKQIASIENFKFNVKEVMVSGKVEKFTEGIVKVPYIITGIPDDLNLTTLTKTVEVTYVVGLSNFGKIDENSFKIECNYQESLTNNLGYLIPKLTYKSALVKSFKIIPNKIDFLIQR